MNKKAENTATISTSESIVYENGLETGTHSNKKNSFYVHNFDIL